MSSAAGTRAVLFAEIIGLARSLPRGFYLKHARNSDAAVFWIPAFAGMTSCPPFDFALMLSFISCLLHDRFHASVLACSWHDNLALHTNLPQHTPFGLWLPECEHEAVGHAASLACASRGGYPGAIVFGMTQRAGPCGEGKACFLHFSDQEILIDAMQLDVLGSAAVFGAVIHDGIHATRFERLVHCGIHLVAVDTAQHQVVVVQVHNDGVERARRHRQ